MGTYKSGEPKQRWKAIAAVAAVHAVLGAVILTGLNIDPVTRAVERLSTFDVAPPAPPPPPPPPPQEDRQQTPDEGAPESSPEPSPVVAPEPKVEVPAKSPVAAAEVAGSGSGTSAGSGGTGSGTGSGGGGSGSGSGGNAVATPARQISRIPNREYRRLSSVSGMPRGRVGVAHTINADGSVSNCRITGSSGSPAADSLMCRLIAQYIRFRPARNSQGQPIAVEISGSQGWN